jgi:hypothetical protein
MDQLVYQPAILVRGIGVPGFDGNGRPYLWSSVFCEGTLNRNFRNTFVEVNKVSILFIQHDPSDLISSKDLTRGYKSGI